MARTSVNDLAWYQRLPTTTRSVAKRSECKGRTASRRANHWAAVQFAIHHQSSSRRPLDKGQPKKSPKGGGYGSLPRAWRDRIRLLRSVEQTKKKILIQSIIIWSRVGGSSAAAALLIGSSSPAGYVVVQQCCNDTHSHAGWNAPMSYGIRAV
eukprot:scaffold3842_cov158-Amphora_coffeaeformis.AAC.3